MTVRPLPPAHNQAGPPDKLMDLAVLMGLVLVAVIALVLTRSPEAVGSAVTPVALGVAYYRAVRRGPRQYQGEAPPSDVQ
jgi:hypothetical protein